MRALALVCLLAAICCAQAAPCKTGYPDSDRELNRIFDAVKVVMQDLQKYVHDYKTRMNVKLKKPTATAIYRIERNVKYLTLQIRDKVNAHNKPCYELTLGTLKDLIVQGNDAVEMCAASALEEVDFALRKAVGLIKVARQIITDLETIVPMCERRTERERKKCILWRISENDNARDSLERSARSVKQLAENAIAEALAWNADCNNYQVADFQRKAVEVKTLSDPCLNTYHETSKDKSYNTPQRSQ